MAKTTIVDRDRGWKSLMRKITDLVSQRRELVVGVTSDRYVDGNSVAEIAMIHEFGTATVPQRSFIRSTLDKHGLTYSKQLAEGVQAAIVDAVNGKLDTDQKALNRLGMRIKGDIQKRIAQGISPPNAPATIARKGSSTPLIDSGQLRASITYELRKGGR